jgi:hypothetical protein
MNIHGKSHPERRRKMGHAVVKVAIPRRPWRAEASRTALKAPRRG